MSNPHLSNEEFFNALKALLQKQSTRARGSIFLTQKRLPAPSTSSDTPASTDTTTTAPTVPSPVLIRATNGQHKAAKVKASTIVQPGDIEGFFLRYAEICKGGMVGMKKRDRSGKKKGKGKGKKEKEGKEKA
ncbi:hypothetical protein AJ79_09935 [Helicocarpus griseus UAMH5409]|uniref:Signal recognition particle subunit SRP14 n=1 Tax=Helicocarpus griseus UAMH5409 TaxID=1447875 RepID=A0A2B7WGE8_9EURO|nr:hypothetical protein AJ79_09935 [Helicocarpus griseus UAMH5409]